MSYEEKVDIFRTAVEAYAAKLEREGHAVRATCLKFQHPDWTDEMIEAHLALHAAPLELPRPGYIVGDRDGEIRIYSGAQPASPNLPPSGQLLATIPLDNLPPLGPGDKVVLSWRPPAPAPTPATPRSKPRLFDSLRSWLRR